MHNWMDDFHSAYARNLGRIVKGKTLDIGDNERGIEEKTVEIERIHSVTVGIDSNGIFAAINVIDTEGNGWALYSDGTISDEDDQTVGRHMLTTLPERTEPLEPTDDEIYNRIGVEGGIGYSLADDSPGSLGENDWRL